MDIRKYLQRIGVPPPAPPGPSWDALRALHRGHLLSVPFENLALHCEEGGRLLSPADLQGVYDKIVTRRRGGLCYENNGLFSWLLSALHFEVTLLSAQVKNSLTGRYGPPFDHLLSMVRLGGRRWLCDVGFGGAGFRDPLSLEAEEGEPQRQGHRVYRVRKDRDTRFVEWLGEGDEAGEWVALYKFTLDPRQREDFAEMCDYHQSSPSSLFFCKSVCTMGTPNGRLTYMGHTLTTTTFPTATSALTTTARTLEEEDIPLVLETHFGVVLTSPLVPKNQDILPPSVVY
ncbi:hypothetical protein NHX12_021540 [Muraenolepis orangiensis]|uniref:arylamine N-acetyltransferase n=1 Tax=Muraenolepis orangiensis TaxID=630683 RepID=A0A9Q0ETS2_9TELE|nr:hypothetical protein NHX12_021540 [Muraenolepis orangiensis]